MHTYSLNYCLDSAGLLCVLAPRAAMQSHLDKMWHLDVANFGGQVFNLPEACTSVCTLSCDSAVDIAASSAERCALLALKHCETEPNPESDATLTSLEMTVVNALDGPQLRGGHVFRNLAGDLLVSCGLDGQVMCGAVDDWVCEVFALWGSLLAYSNSLLYYCKKKAIPITEL